MSNIDLTPKDWADDFVYGGRDIKSPTELVLQRLRDRLPGTDVVAVIQYGRATGKSTSIGAGKKVYRLKAEKKRG